MIVEAPDGKVIEFPDSMDAKAIEGVMAKEYGGGKQEPRTNPETPGLLSRLYGVLNKRTEAMDKNITGAGPAEALLRAAGGVAGGIGDVIGETGKSLIGAVLPNILKEGSKKNINEIMATPAAQQIVKATQPIFEKYAEMKKAHPDATKDVEAVTNLATLLPIGKGAKMAVKGAEEMAPVAGKAAEDVGQGLLKLKQAVKPSPTKEEALGQILQGKTKDLSKGERALKAVDTEGVKTYSQLKTKLDDAIPQYAKEVDKELAKDTKKYILDELVTEGKTTSGEKVNQNFVQSALQHLNELYMKTEEPVKAQNISELLIKAKDKGLTKVEVNDLARKYGSEFGDKAFSKATGDPLTSVNAQAYENVRSGLKEVARRGLSDNVKELDATLSSIYNTRKLVDKNVEAVNKLRQKIDQRGFGEKLGRKAWEAFDIATMGTVKGAMLKMLPRGMGYKVKNFLDLEESLSRNLKIVNKALNAKTDAETVQIIKKAPLSLGPAPTEVAMSREAVPVTPVKLSITERQYKGGQAMKEGSYMSKEEMKEAKKRVKKGRTVEAD